MDDSRPMNIEAEEATIGSLLIDHDAILYVIDIIKPADFFIARNQWIYNSIVDLHRANKPIDLLAIEAELKRHNRNVDTSYLLELINRTPTSIHAAHYAALIKEASIKRQLINAAGSIAKISYNGASADEAISKSMAALMEVTIGNITNKPKAVNEITPILLDEVTAMAEGNRPPGIPTQLKDIDKLIGGYKPGKLYLVAGRPGMGKSSLVLQSAIEAARLGKQVLYFSREMPAVELVGRMVSFESGIDSNLIENGTLSKDQWAQFYNALQIVEEWPIYIDDKTRTIEGIRAKTVLQSAKGLDLLIVDYVQRVLTDIKYQNRDSEVGAVGTELKSISIEQELPVIAVASLNRQCESRADKRPMLSDLRESGNLEYDADVVMFLYRDEVYNKKTDFPNLAELEVAKQRGGRTGILQLYFKKHLTKFIDLEINRTALERALQ